MRMYQPNRMAFQQWTEVMAVQSNCSPKGVVNKPLPRESDARKIHDFAEWELGFILALASKYDGMNRGFQVCDVLVYESLCSDQERGAHVSDPKLFRFCLRHRFPGGGTSHTVLQVLAGERTANGVDNVLHITVR
jgi:hypothetical protein